MTALPYSPECHLVFRSADPQVDAAELHALARAVHDWPRVAALATREVAVPTLWRALQPIEGELPADAAAYLRGRAVHTDLQMQQFALRVQRTVRALVEARIPVMLLKGVAVGALVDATFRARPMTDADLLVQRADVARARDVVIASGWPETTDPVLRDLLQDGHHLPHFVDPQLPGLRVELHVAVMPDEHPFAFGEAELWRDAQPAAGPFAGAVLPSDVHLVLHAAVHYAWQHQMTFGAWRTFRKVALVTQRAAFDWVALVRAARGARGLSSGYWTLRLAARLSGVDVPRDVLSELAPPTGEWLNAAIERSIVARIATESPASPSQKVSRLLWRTALRPRWSGLARLGRSDPTQRWSRAMGTRSTETAPQRWRRHLTSYRAWWSFARETLLGLRTQRGTR